MATKIIRLPSNSAFITAAAQTVDLAFTADPFINWLRPHVGNEAENHRHFLKWQYRRFQRARVEGCVLVAVPESSQKQQKPVVKAVGLVYPSKSSWSAWLRSLPTRCWLYLSDWLDPVKDKQADLNRVGKMIETHYTVEESLKAKFGPSICYIEVVAVDPAFQGQQLGSQMLQHLLEQCNPGQPVYLECTQKSNVRFYEKFGFELVEEEDLVDPSAKVDDRTSLWIMVRR